LLHIGSYLAAHGFEIEIIDTHIERDYQKRIETQLANNEYVFVGMSVIIGKFMKNAAELTKMVRSIKDVPIVWGGIMASIEPEACLQTYHPDYIVRFEGEKTALELALAILNNSGVEHIQGISYMRDGKLISNAPRMPKRYLDEYPIPDWELFGTAFNKEQIPYYYVIMSSRGCPFNCNFCYKHSIDPELQAKMPAWRRRSSQHVIKELEYVHQKTGTRVFTFGDDNFMVDKKRAMEIFNYCRQNGFYIEECIGHLNCLDDDLIDSMAGIVQTLMFSIESASQRLQQYIQKKLDLESVPSKVNKLYEHGVAATIAFIIGLPTEADEDLRKNVELMLQLKELHPFARARAYLYLPLPKTKLYKIVEETYHLKLPTDIRAWEEANLWVDDIDDPVGNKFRPWLSKERFQFLIHYGMVFGELFKVNNSKRDPVIQQILERELTIKKMFQGTEQVNHPKTDYIPYVLDKALAGEKIDLINGLKGK